MKKLIIVIVVGLITTFSAKAQHIPDNNFAKAIRKVCNECIDANNDLLPAAQKLEKLNVSFGDIESLEGIQGFSSLTMLDCDENQRLASLHDLPVTLKALHIKNTGINNIASFPPKLEDFYGDGCPLKSLPTLPVSLENLECSNCGLTALPQLPESLMDLDVTDCPIAILPSLPVGLQMLYIRGTKITSLPQLPDKLYSLNVSDNIFDCIPSNNPDLMINHKDKGQGLIPFCKRDNKLIAKKSTEPQVPEIKKCINGDCKNGIGTLEADNSEGHITYIGSFKNDLYNGQGSIIVKDKYKYTGSFKDGVLDGKGVFTSFDNGFVYTGEFKNGSREGAGTLVFKDGKKSTGIWKENKLWTGTGLFKYGEKEYYYGEVKENRPDGKGTFTYANGKTFTGTFTEGNPITGKGYFFSRADSVGYEGNFVNGKYSGMGTYTNPHGEVFRGNFIDGTLNGNIKWSNTKGNKYEGNFANRNFDGYGVMTYFDGWIYKGNWKNSKRDGQGMMYDKDGNLDYSGDWNNGEMTYPEKAVSYKKSIWEDSKKLFSRVTFKGWQKIVTDEITGEAEMTDEYHLNSDYTFYGTNEYVILFDGKQYRTKQKTEGTFDPVTYKLHISAREILYHDKIEGVTWLRGSADGVIYGSNSHPGHYVIKGKDISGNDFEEHDY